MNEVYSVMVALKPLEEKHGIKKLLKNLSFFREILKIPSILIENFKRLLMPSSVPGMSNIKNVFSIIFFSAISIF